MISICGLQTILSSTKLHYLKLISMSGFFNLLWFRNGDVIKKTAFVIL